jgi:PAS domain S-box-containing protein
MNQNQGIGAEHSAPQQPATGHHPPHSDSTLKKRFGRRSIRYKLSLAILLTTMTALLVSGISIIFYDLGDYRERTFEDLRTQADLIGQASAAALQFEDPAVAEQTLALLRLRPQIRAAAIYTPDGGQFARYLSLDTPSSLLTQLPADRATRIKDGMLSLSQPIRFDNELLGTIQLISAYRFQERLLRDIGIVLGVAVLALAIAMLISHWIQARITRPVLRVTELAHSVIQQRNYSLRMTDITDDEIGYLMEVFNALLSEIGRRTEAMETSNQQLENEVKERSAAEKALRSSELRHRTLVTELTAVVWQADANGDFNADQPAWDAYTGQTPNEHRGLGWINALHQEDRAELALRWQQACELARPFAGEMRLWHAANGDYRHVNLRAVPLKGADGRTLEWIGIVDDVHERVQSSEEIRQLNSRLEQRVEERTAELANANQELEAFSYSVSHDLRAPLRSIDGFSMALLEDYDQVLDDTGRDYLNRVRGAAQRMGTLIDDLLKLSRVSRAEIDRQPLNLSDIAQDIVTELHESDPQREIDITIADGLGAYGDARLLRVVLDNLLNNAWKYTGKTAAARIEFGIRDYEGTPSFFIQDNGAGFDMAYAGRLFSAFQRLHDARDYPGTGVGLATVQRIIRRHGGQIWAQADIGKGAVFYFTLPQTQEIAEGDTT